MFEMSMKPSATVAKLKDKLSGPSGIHAEEQVILNGNRILDDQATIDSYHLREGVILDMEIGGGISVLLIGNKGVGKTAILSSFVNPLAKLKTGTVGENRDPWTGEITSPGGSIRSPTLSMPPSPASPTRVDTNFNNAAIYKSHLHPRRRNPNPKPER